MALTAFDQASNFCLTTVVSGQLNNTTSPVTFDVADATYFPTTGGNGYFLGVWDSGSYVLPWTDPNFEFIRVTSRTGVTVTATRAALGTNANVHPGTPAISLLDISQYITALQTAVNALQAKGSPIYDEVIGTANASTKIFVLANTPVTNTVRIYVAGQRQIINVHYTLTGSTVTFDLAPTIGVVTADYQM